MVLNNLSLLNYKNFETVSFEFDSKINCLVGNNGVGKTNVLDAIYHLSFGKSYFNPITVQNIKHGEAFFVVEGNYIKKEREEKIIISAKKGHKKVIKRNGKPYSRFSEHIGFLPLVIISPTDRDLGFQNFIQEPKESEAMNEMFQAQSYYEQALIASTKDSLFTLSLNGGNGKFGFLDIIDNYSGTNAANLASYYAGIAYLNTGNYQEAIEHLDNFKSDDANVAPIAKGAIGDAFAQLDQQEDALKYYESAASMSSSELTSPRFLLKAGITAIGLGKSDVALKHFNTIIDNYPNSPEATKAILYQGKAEAMQ
jgi:tetratricopeptide (TPR) repeat protein